MIAFSELVDDVRSSVMEPKLFIPVPIPDLDPDPDHTFTVFQIKIFCCKSNGFVQYSKQTNCESLCNNRRCGILSNILFYRHAMYLFIVFSL
jgi:hypothetical protein